MHVLETVSPAVEHIEDGGVLVLVATLDFGSAIGQAPKDCDDRLLVVGFDVDHHAVSRRLLLAVAALLSAAHAVTDLPWPTPPRRCVPSPRALVADAVDEAGDGGSVLEELERILWQDVNQSELGR